jgi:hypothetical protein
MKGLASVKYMLNCDSTSSNPSSELVMTTFYVFQEAHSQIKRTCQICFQQEIGLLRGAYTFITLVPLLHLSTT